MSKIKSLSFLLSVIIISAGCGTSVTATPLPVENISYTESARTPVLEIPTYLSTPVSSGFTGRDPVSLAWFYKPPENGTLATLSKNFNFFILTHRDEEVRDQLRALGVDATMYQYLLFVQIMDPGSCTERPYGNQVAYQVGDFCWIQSEHPDWFLRDRHGNIIRKDLNAYMDAGNAEYRRFWLDRAQKMQEEFGWDGIFIDNVEASLDKLNRLGTPPAKYSTDSEYQVAIVGFLQFLHEKYFKPRNKPVMANIIELRDEAVWFHYMQYLDGAMIEAFSVDYNDRYLLPNHWTDQINLAINTQALGKTVILVAQGNENDRKREEFALGSYLLVNDGRAVFRYTNSDNYEQIWLYENYTIDLGLPHGPAYQEGPAWQRDFERGTVTVNPFTFTTELTIK